MGISFGIQVEASQGNSSETEEFRVRGPGLQSSFHNDLQSLESRKIAHTTESGGVSGAGLSRKVPDETRVRNAHEKS